MVKPGDFYIGVISFSSILVPGAIAVAVLEPLLSAAVVNPIMSIPESGVAPWIAFLISAYFLGHLIFLLGSYLDGLYEKIRGRFMTYRAESANENAYLCAKEIRDEILKSDESDAISTFQWSRAVLSALFPVAASDLHELEAASKFFRSLVIVLILVGAILLYNSFYIGGAISLAFVPPCFIRYYERRLKSTTQAYTYIIALHRLGKLRNSSENPPNTAAQPDSCAAG